MGLLIPIRSLSPESSAYPGGIHKGHLQGLPGIEPRLVSENIKWNTAIFGVLGSMVIWQAQARPLLSIPVPVIQAQVEVNASEGKTATPSLSLPVPVIAAVTSQSTVADPERTVLHDDDPPSDSELSTEASSDPVIDQFWLQNDDNQETFTGNNWRAMTFTPETNHTIRGVRLALYGSSIGTITVSVRATASGLPTGSDLCSGTLDGSQLNGTWDGKVYDISLGAGAALTAGTVYALVVRTASGNLSWRSSPAGYDRGQKCTSANAGVAWTADANRELLFAEFGENSLDVPATPTPTAVGDGLYIGHSDPFDYADLWVNQAGAGTYTITWKYYNGTSWLPLTLTGFGDRTNSWKRPGRHTIMFIRPGDWAANSILGYTLYWIKAEVTAYTSQTTQPVLGRVWIGTL